MAIFQRLLVLLDQSTSCERVFAQALDLARRLEIPIQGVFISAGALDENNHLELPTDRRGQPVSFPPSQEMGISSTIKETEHRCAVSCAKVNVPWQPSFWDGRSVAGLRELAEPTDLLILGQTLRPLLKKELFREALRPGFPPMLVYSPTAPSISRALVIDRVSDSDGQSFLTAAIALCHRLQVHPIVLTVARSERAARARQQAARDVVAARGLDADFDFIVGAEVRTAVIQVAQWRRCPLVVLERQGSTPWLRWWRAPTAAWLVNFADSFSLLTLPGAGVAFDSASCPTPSPAPGSLYNQGLSPVPKRGDRAAKDNPRGPAGELDPLDSPPASWQPLR